MSRSFVSDVYKRQVVEHVKRNALAVGLVYPEVINGGGVSVHVGITFFIPPAAANPADLLTNTIGLRRGGRNDLIFPPAGLALLSLLAILADLNVATFAIRLPSCIVGKDVYKRQRMPGVVLRVSTSTVLVPSSAATIRCV